MRELKITKIAKQAAKGAKGTAQEFAGELDKKMSNIEMAKAQANADENEVSGVDVKQYDVNWDDESKAAYDQEILRITKDKKAPKKPKTLEERNAGIKSFLEKRYNK